jgi:hypothetical protein
VFNEPDSKKQANLDVKEAIAAWSLVQSTGLLLGSPACVHAKNAWMTDFVAQLEGTDGLRMDYITVHWYGSPNAQAFQDEMKSIHDFYNARWPLWITEFAPADWSATTPHDNRYSRHEVLAFMKQVLPWLERQDFIAAYSWFSFSADSKQGTCSSLFELDNTLTPLGKYYASVNNTHPLGDQSITVM